jgi:3,4-dihydroxy 2-butanone 4-phosphate synthase/GTP cyclohydrolase II
MTNTHNTIIPPKSETIGVRFTSHKLKLAGFPDVQVRVYEVEDYSPILTLIIGEIVAEKAPLVRIHSRCAYGELFGSLDCDCQSQLDTALLAMRDEDMGIFIYLEQEGRGAGIVSKARAYELKDRHGLDTVEAYRSMGLEPDMRDYTPVIQILLQMGLRHVRLLTNNPKKVSALTRAGFKVDQIPLRTKPTQHNLDYLKVKQNKLAHSLGLDFIELIKEQKMEDN